MKLNLICKYCYLFILTILIVSFFITAPLSAEEIDNSKKLNLTAKVDAFLTYSHSQGSDSLLGGSFNALLAPHYKLNEKAIFIFMYDGSYYRKREYYSDDLGYLQRTQFQSHDFTPMVRFKLGNGSRFTLTPSCFYTATFNIDVEPEGWGDGWYNYRDIGLGLDFTDKRLGVYKFNGVLKFGFQGYQRHFPNFPSPVEENEKDYTGIIMSMAYQHKSNSDLSWSTEYFLLYKMLDNKMVDDELGNPTSEEQRDSMHNFILSLGYALSKSLEIGVDIDLELYRSNQNYFAGLFSGGYTPNFYSYNSYGARPYLSHTFESRPVITQFSYAYHKTEYNDRIAKDSNQNLKPGENQCETQHNILFKAGYVINKNWQVISKIQRVVVDSNNQDETVYKYSYTDTSFSVGISYKY